MSFTNAYSLAVYALEYGLLLWVILPSYSRKHTGNGSRNLLNCSNQRGVQTCKTSLNLARRINSLAGLQKLAVYLIAYQITNNEMKLSNRLIPVPEQLPPPVTPDTTVHQSASRKLSLGQVADEET